jgi:hypothetical protein
MWVCRIVPGRAGGLTSEYRSGLAGAKSLVGARERVLARRRPAATRQRDR